MAAARVIEMAYVAQCIYNQWPVGVRILNRSLGPYPYLFEFRHFVALRGKHVELSATKKIIITFSKNAGHLLISRDRGTSDENAGLSLRMRDGWRRLTPMLEEVQFLPHSMVVYIIVFHSFK